MTGSINSFVFEAYFPHFFNILKSPLSFFAFVCDVKSCFV